MFELPDYTGRDPEHIKNSLTFFVYHAGHTLGGKKKIAALEAIRAEAANYGVELEQEDLYNG